MPSVGFTTNGALEESQDDVTPPSILMEHPPIAVFVNGKYHIIFSIIYSSSHGISRDERESCFYP